MKDRPICLNCNRHRDAHYGDQGEWSSANEGLCTEYEGRSATVDELSNISHTSPTFAGEKKKK